MMFSRNAQTRMPGLPLFSLSLVALAVSLPARADDDAERQATRDNLDHVVVTAPTQDSPLTVLLNPKKPVQPVPASDGGDFLKSVPGFSLVRKGGANGDPVLRGMGGSRLGIALDGGQLYGGCPSRMDPPTAYVSPELYDRVVIVKGPESVLDGPGLSAGSVRFEKDFQRFETPGYRLDASLLGGAWGRNDQMLDLRAEAAEGFAAVTANHTHAQDYRDGNGDKVFSYYDRWNVDTTVGWTPSEDTRLEFSAGRGDGQAAYAYSGMDGAQFLRESFGLHLVTEHLSAWWTKLEVSLYDNDADHIMDNYSLRDPDPGSMMPMAMASQVERRARGGRVAGDFVLGEAWNLTAGIDAIRSQHTARDGGPAGSMSYFRDLPREKDADLDNTGLFAELTDTLADKQRWISGLRRDQAYAKGYDLSTATSGMGSMGGMGGMGGMPMPVTTVDASRSDNLWSGFTRYERDLADSPTTVYAGIGYVERFPDYWELVGRHADKSLSAFKGLDPEVTTQLDVGAQYRDATVKAWASAYVGVVHDYILIHHAQGMMSPGYAENIDARIAGAELGLSWTFAERWTLDSSASYAWGENRSAERALPQMSPAELRLGLNYDQGDWSLGGLWRVVAHQGRVAVGEGTIAGEDVGETSGFSVFSVNGGYRLSRALTLTAGIDNLFDKAYAEHLNAAPVELAGYRETVQINEPGRTWWMKLNLSL